MEVWIINFSPHASGLSWASQSGEPCRSPNHIIKYLTFVFQSLTINFLIWCSLFDGIPKRQHGQAVLFQGTSGESETQRILGSLATLPRKWQSLEKGQDDPASRIGSSHCVWEPLASYQQSYVILQVRPG